MLMLTGPVGELWMFCHPVGIYLMIRKWKFDLIAQCILDYIFKQSSLIVVEAKIVLRLSFHFHEYNYIKTF